MEQGTNNGGKVWGQQEVYGAIFGKKLDSDRIIINETIWIYILFNYRPNLNM